MKFLFLIFLLCIFLNISLSEISFGTYQYEKILEVKNESLITSKILIWNSGNKEIEVIFEILEKPKGIEVYLDKKRLILSHNDTEYKDYEIIFINNKEIKAIPINIYFYFLDEKTEGYVYVRAYAESVEKHNIPIKQERIFTFLIKRNKDVEKLEDKNNVITTKTISEIIEKNYLNILPLIIILFSIVLSTIIILKFKKG